MRILLLCFCLSVFAYGAEPEQTFLGIDVSHHQGKINWPLVAQGDLRFAYLKASEGISYKDSHFLQNLDEVKKTKLIPGAYHYYSLCRAPLEQAKNFISTVPKQKGMMPPAVDVEFKGNCKKRPEASVFHADLLKYLTEVETYFGVKPIVYTTYEFYARYLGNPAFDSYSLWIRNVKDEPTGETRVKPLIRQISGRMKIKGIDGFVDLNVLLGPLPGA